MPLAVTSIARDLTSTVLAADPELVVQLAPASLYELSILVAWSEGSVTDGGLAAGVLLTGTGATINWIIPPLTQSYGSGNSVNFLGVAGNQLLQITGTIQTSPTVGATVAFIRALAQASVNPTTIKAGSTLDAVLLSATSGVSGTYKYNPAFSSAILLAYSRIGKRRPSLTTEHFADASDEGNLLLSEWSNEQPLLWKSEIFTLPLVQGAPTYTLDKQIVMLLDVRVETGSGQNIISRILGPLSTVEYDSIPNKQSQSPSSSYFFNRQITPTITFWPVPDAGGPYIAQIRAVTQVQDVTIPNGATMDLPYRAFDAFVAGLAYRLARIHAPELEDKRKLDYDRAWQIFSGNDVENVNLYIIPQLSAYRRP